jgi:hypothetical protein
MKTKEQTIEEYTRLLSPCELAALLIEAQTTSNQAIDLLTTALINDQAKEKTIKEQAEHIKYLNLEIKCKQKTIDELTDRKPDPRQQEQAKINKALQDIAEAIEEAHGTAVESLHFAYIIPTQTDQLTDALSEAIDALKTAYTLAEALQNQPHEFQR